MSTQPKLSLSAAEIPGVFVAETNAFRDHRGFFARLYCERELEPAIGNARIVQISQSQTRTAGTVRGLHYQRGMMKLVRCLRGRVWDVAVDLRKSSPTYLKWHAVELSPENGRMLIVPGGCAQGFQVLEPDTELLYLHTAFYDPTDEGGVPYDDPAIGIRWPLPIAELSARDRALPPITSDFPGLEA